MIWPNRPQEMRITHHIGWNEQDGGNTRSEASPVNRGAGLPFLVLTAAAHSAGARIASEVRLTNPLTALRYSIM